MFLYPPTPCQAGAGACATAKHFPQLAIARHQACAKTLARHQAHGKAFARHQARPKPWPSLCARAASDALLFMHLLPQKGTLSLPCTVRWGLVFSAAQACSLALWLRSVALPKLCQGFCFRVSGVPFSAPTRLRFWCIFGPFPCFAVLKGSLWGLVFGAAQACSLSLWLRSMALPRLGQRLFLPDLDASFSAPRLLRFGSVFGPFGAAVPLRFPVFMGSVFGACLARFRAPRRCVSLFWRVRSVWLQSVALPKLWLLLTGFGRPVFGRESSAHGTT